MKYFDEPSAIKAVLLNVISIFISVIIIYFLPDVKNKISPKYNHVTILYWMAILYSFFYYKLAGGFSGIIFGNLAGSLYTYLKLFLDIRVVLLMIIFYQIQNFNILFIILGFVLLQTYCGSRSAIISLIIIMLLIPASINFKKYRKKILMIVCLIAFMSPFLFLIATKVRDIKLNTMPLFYSIVGRISMIELTMAPVYYKDHNEKNLAIFYEKYSMDNQLKLILNSMVPGDIFKSDVDPNQYYRSAFMGIPLDLARKSYTSLNMSLPVFLYMYTNSFLAVYFTVFIFVSYYLFIVLIARRMTLLLVPLLLSFYGFLYFFDFVMFFRDLFNCMLTILSIIIFNQIYLLIRNSFKLYRNTQN